MGGRTVPGWSLRGRLLVAHLVVIAVGMVTLLALVVLIAPGLFDRLMVQAMASPLMASMHAESGQIGGGMDLMSQLTAQAFRRSMTQALLLASAAAILAAVVVSVWTSERLLRPLERLLQASRRIASGRYAERVAEDQPGELALLARGFNEMATALETAERRRLELMGNVAHELRTPLTHLRGQLEGLLDGVVADDQATWAFLHGEVGRLSRLVDDLQELSRAEAGQIPLRPRGVAPAHLLELARRRHAEAYKEQGVELAVSAPGGPPAVVADEDRTVQVLSNLLHNALRHTPAGGSVRVWAEARGPGVVFQVRDTGSGVPPEHLPHLFERFYRVEGSRSRAGGGSGIGLTVARLLVEAQGGRIWAESAGPGQGSTFAFSLPRA